ncbi:MAG: fatty acid desaturase [Pseudomonadota bacterium]
MDTKRDYSLTGESAKRAIEIGLTTAAWYHTELSRKDMKALMGRRDGPALRDTALYYGVMLASVTAAIALWPSWWSAPLWLIYGVFYASGADSRWHECGHGTAFKTRWMNKLVYHIACFCLLRNPILWRWSHTRHHIDTIIVGRDPEIITMRPPDMIKVFFLFVGWDSVQSFFKMFRYATTGLNAEEKTYVPKTQWHRPGHVARLWIVIFACVLGLALWLGSILPLMVIGGPIFYGSWHYVVTGLLQHTGLADNVIDHRLNSRTVYMNPLSRFIYWNMNYHIEHHMFPMVPYHALPDLHALIRHDLPPPNRTIVGALIEVFGALKKQLSDPEYRIKKDLPETARPYRFDLHAQALG